MIRWYVSVNFFIDFLFFLDIIVNFMTAFHRDNHELIDDRCEIVKNYLTTWFFIDLLAIFPTEIMVNLMNRNDDSSTSQD